MLVNCSEVHFNTTLYFLDLRCYIQCEVLNRCCLISSIILFFSVCRYIRPQFFYNNPLLSFIQYVIGPYTDDLGNVLPYAVEGVGVPVDPLAFSGLLGESCGLHYS